MELNRKTMEIRPIKRLIKASLLLHLLGWGMVVLALFLYRPIVLTFEYLLADSNLAYLSLIHLVPDVMTLVLHAGLAICACLMLRAQSSLRACLVFAVIATMLVFLMVDPLNLSPLTYSLPVYERTQAARAILSFGFVLRDLAVMMFLLPVAMLWYHRFVNATEK